MLSCQKSRNKKFIIKPRKFWLILSLCLILIVSLTFTSQIKPASASTISVPTDYPTIQEAVNNADDGDTILVAPEIYPEHVSINKSITLVGNISDPTTTIIDGTSNGTVIELEGGGITITGFTIRNAGHHSAITSERDKTTNDWHDISHNIIENSQYGISLGLSKRNTIANNSFFGNPISGIDLNEADNNDIIGNTILESAYGIRIVQSIGNTITGNTISGTSYAIHLSFSSTGNTISYNFITGKTIGIFSNSDGNTVDHNTITKSAYGIYFYNCKSGSIYYNTIKNNSYGIRLYWSSLTSSNHNVNNNKLVDNDWGIEQVYSSGNTFMGNWLQENTWGVFSSFSTSNTFYRNNFVQNNMQAFADALNSWDMGGEGNYWSDYAGEDTDPPDGIGDTPHPIIPGYDYYPLMNTWSEHDISIQNVTLSTNETYPSEIVNITVTVKNKANISVSETFTVTAKYDLNIIETKPVNNLAQGATETLTFNWNTTGVASENYTISAEASVVPDELNTDNNNFIGGTVKIMAPLLGDIDDDGTININDLILLVEAYGATSTSPNWNPDADLNDDNIINMLDLSLLGKNYGKTI